ncbi:hypothetical protein ONZ45_g9660 [Pleurotus djamor]|nr:hypothetical protein ONZ45_g9660 [Pleurotus djamor]
MPTIAPGSKVLVSGASGFIASWVTKTLLDKGYSVRGTARSESKAKYLRELFSSYGDKFETAIVEDISKDGAFDEAVKGVDGIEHLASPFHTKAEDPQDIIGPAVSGTVGILSSVLKNNPNVKRVVITSSCASVLEVNPTPTKFSEKDWNQQSLDQVKEQGKAAAGITKYRASKTLAEKAAWEFVEKHKNEIKWDIAVINPPYVFGPVIHEAPTRDVLNTSSADILRVLLTPSDSPSAMSPEALKTTGSCWIDVRDLAEGHVRALEIPEAGGERVIISAGPFVWQEWLDAANALSPPATLPTSVKLASGVPGSAAGAIYMIDYDTAKAAKIFGLKYRTMQETVRDVLEDVAKRGWS